MLASLKNLNYKNFEVIIVDNASKEDPQPIINLEFPEVIVVKSAENLGFAGGNNLGLAKAKGKYVFYINNDTEVTPELLKPLVDLFESNPKVGMATPKIKYYDTQLIQYAGSNAINSFTGRGSSIGYQELDNGQYNYLKITDLPHGAALMVPRAVIENVCLMPELFFLYYEEHDWAESIKRAGYQIYYVGTAEIYHKESISVGKLNPMKTYFMTRNRLLFMKRNTSGFPQIIGFLFFTCFSIPKNIVSYIVKTDWKHLIAFLKGIKGYFFIRKPNENIYWAKPKL
ncbi:MAG: glycosyltransferase family 2 protein [Cytophagales bacterium]|nr:MAG: glycosyltransferase family 2 protein [Cytophagales bacterium]